MNERLEEEIQASAEMEMTPMIDVVFLLIIFFLCIDFKVLEAKIPAYLPKDVGTQTTQTEPVEKLNIKIVCEAWGNEIPRRKPMPGDDPNKKRAYRLDGHKVRWEVGPRGFRTKEDLLEELTRIARDPSKRQPDPDNPGKTKLMGVVIEPGQQTTYGDVATTMDMVNAAGFEDVSFGGGQGAREGD